MPFLEHPSGEDDTAVDAMARAITRLRQLQPERWLTFSAQGQGGRIDSYHFAELRLLGDRIDPRQAVLDADLALRTAGLDRAELAVAKSPEGFFVTTGFTPRQVALFMDALFRGQMGIRPHDGEGDEHAVGAEW